MAGTQTAVDSGDVTRLGNDKPLLLSNHRLEDATTLEWDAAGVMGSTTTTDADYPIRLAYDRRLDDVTQPDTPGTTHYLMFDAGSGNTFGDFDVVVIAGHNFSGRTITIDAIVTDDGDFTGTGSGRQIIETWTNPTTSERLVSFALFHTGSDPLTYQDYRYFGIKLVDGSSFTPQIGEVWIGQRCQMHRKGDRPDTSYDRRSVFREFATDGQNTFRQILAKKQAVFSRSWQLNDSTLITNVETFRADAEYGGKPFLYWENPNSAPNDAFLMLNQGQIALPEVGVSLRSLTLDMVENAPMVDLET